MFLQNATGSNLGMMTTGTPIRKEKVNKLTTPGRTNRISAVVLNLRDGLERHTVNVVERQYTNKTVGHGGRRKAEVNHVCNTR